VPQEESVYFYFVYSLILPEELPEWSWSTTTQRTALVVISSVPLFLLFNSLFEYVQKRRMQTKPPRRRQRESL